MAKSDIVDLLLVRTGRTEWDDTGRLQGGTDLPLSEGGRSDLAQTLDGNLKHAGSPAITLVIHAPDEASSQSARMLSELGGGKLKPGPGLGAMRLGLWEGLLETELMDRYPTSYRQWRDNPAMVNPPEGETLLDTQLRLVRTLLKATERSAGKTVAVVLRPLEFGLLRGTLAGRPTTDLWTLIEDGPATERFSVARGSLKNLIENFKARI